MAFADRAFRRAHALQRRGAMSKVPLFVVRAAATPLLALALVGCGPIWVQSPTPRPTVVTVGTTDGTIRLAKRPPRELCDAFGVRELCVRGTTETMRTGARTALAATMNVVDGPKADFTADVEPIGIRIERNAWNNHVRLRLEWAFTVRLADGSVVIDANSTSSSPDMVPVHDVPFELGLLQNQALGEMRELLEDYLRKRNAVRAAVSTPR